MPARSDSALWRTAATEAELAEVEEIDKAAAAITRGSFKLRSRRSLITNRALQRALRKKSQTGAKRC